MLGLQPPRLRAQRSSLNETVWNFGLCFHLYLLLCLFGLEFECVHRTEAICLLSAGQGLSTKLLQDLAPRVSALFIEYSLVIVNGTKDPVALGSVKYFGKDGTDTLQIVVIVVRPTYRPAYQSTLQKL
jgi:hypothetical protein